MYKVDARSHICQLIINLPVQEAPFLPRQFRLQSLLNQRSHLNVIVSIGLRQGSSCEERHTLFLGDIIQVYLP